MATITQALEKFAHFHDWYIDIMATRNEADPNVPDTFILGLFQQERRATVMFRGVTRLGIEHGGLLNIIYAIETVEPGGEPHQKALAMLQRSAHDDRRAKHVAYVFSTVGAEIAVEFDSLRIDSV